MQNFQDTPQTRKQSSFLISVTITLFVIHELPQWAFISLY